MRIDWEEELDERLVQRMHRGDGLAFSTLTTRYWPLIHRICSNLLPSAAEALETTEEIFLEMWRAPGAFASGAPFATSLLQHAMRRVLDRSGPPSSEGSLKAFLPRFDAEGCLQGPAYDASARPGMAFGSRELRARIREALRHLEPLDHASFVLREVEGIAADEVAAVLGIAPESVRRRTHRATLMLAGYLGELLSVPRTASVASDVRPG